jgi:hypothetical protein
LKVLGSNFSPDIGYPEVFCGFARSLQTNTEIAASTGHEYILPKHFHFITIIHHPTI